jgi:hypothetical protein
MKYRIKIVTFKNGRQLFYPQVKSTFNWIGLSWEGECLTRESALDKIYKHLEGKKHKIEFEYITRSPATNVCGFAKAGLKSTKVQI